MLLLSSPPKYTGGIYLRRISMNLPPAVGYQTKVRGMKEIVLPNSIQPVALQAPVVPSLLPGQRSSSDE